jgi:hypothetical protein
MGYKARYCKCCLDKKKIVSLMVLHTMIDGDQMRCHQCGVSYYLGTKRTESRKYSYTYSGRAVLAILSKA